MSRVGVRTDSTGDAALWQGIELTVGTAGHSDKANQVEEVRYYPYRACKVGDLSLTKLKESRLRELLTDLGLRLNREIMLMWSVKRLTEDELKDGKSQPSPTFIGAEFVIDNNRVRVVTSGRITRYGIYKDGWIYKRNFESIKREAFNGS